MSTQKKEHILLYKCLFTFIILVIYMVGKQIPLYGIDIQSLKESSLDAQTVFVQTLTGDFSNSTIFTLGLWPYMLGSMIAIVVVAIRSIDKLHKSSPKQTNQITIVITMVIAFFQAWEKIKSYQFLVSGYRLIIFKSFVLIELITGMLIIIWLCVQNQKYGIGGRSLIFLVNIYSGVISMAQGLDRKELIVPLIISAVELAIMLLMEMTEKRIPVQRVSIHSLYADKNYIAYKLNPAGVMPVMFASAFFMLPQFIFASLSNTFPDNRKLEWISNNMKMTSVFGVIVYLVIIWMLVISFSLIMLEPWKTADSLMKSGDSILNIYAGKSTKRYLMGTVIRMSIFSALILSSCIGVPLFLQFNGMVNPALAMLPGSLMMSTGLWIMLYREAKVYRNYENYVPFI